MKRFFKRAVSMGLIATLVATLLPSSFGWSLTAKAAENTVVVSDLMQVKIGETVTDMQLYRNGVYEAACNLTAGTYEANLLVNGETVGDADSVTVSADETVYFRYRDGVFQDSVSDNTLVHSAAIVGNFMGIEFLSDSEDETSRYDIASWNPEDTNAELAYIGGGLYERTYYFKELTEDVELADGGYKVAFDDAWGSDFGNGSSNIALTIPAGSTSLTVLCDEINRVVYDSIRTPDFVIKQNSGDVNANAFHTTVSLIGTARCDEAANWSAGATGYEFSQISDTLFLYQKVFAAGNYEYKCVFNYSNWYEAEGGNKKLAIEADNTNVIFLYDTTTGLLKDSLNNASEVAQALGMEAEPEAPAEAKVEDLANGKTRFTMPVPQGSSVELYYAAKADVEKDGASAFEKLALNKTKTEEETGNDVYQTQDLFLGDNAIDAVYYYMVDGNKQLDSSNDTVTVNGENYSSYTRDAFKGRLVNVPGTFPGPSWDAASNKMTYVGNGIYQYTFKDVPAANYQFKISFGSWDENYGVAGKPGGDNYSLTVPEKQDVTVYYSDFSHLAVTSIDYVFADISLLGTGIPADTKLTDEGLTGIYSVTVPMKKGTYTDLKLHDNRENVSYEFGTVKVDEDKDVTFYYDPSSEVFYCDASNEPIEEEHIYYNTKSSDCKSVYGAVATGEDVTFTIQTGTDIKNVRLVVKGVEKKVLPLEKTGDVTDGVQKWSVTTNFSKIGEVQYYFVLSNGSAVKIYSDDDGYYGEGMVTDLTNIKPYDLVVYQDGFKTPDWMKNAVIYQIFPERFFDGDVSNDFAQTSARGETDYEYITDWDTLPENPEQETKLDEDAYKSTGAYYGDGNWSNEIYGGDLAGITDKIDYLKALGVNVIYINPVFSSISSHRYDTSDYEMIDPILGDLGDFKELVKTAEENDMHIVLDGVFNHVSDDSKYFDRYYKYLEAGTTAVGAYPYWAYVYDKMAASGIDQATAEKDAKEYFKTNYGITDFSYTEWFAVSNDSYITDDNKEVVKDNVGLRAGKPVYSYEGWWGYDSMPVIKSTNGSEYQSGNWGEKIIGNEDGTSVTQYWLSEGSNGWRLDVANEVSDETWQKFRESVKALDSDAVIIGEIWDDATEYLLGDMYDSVMNYVFRNAVLSYAKGGSKEDMEKTLEKIRERYPKEAFYAMMNLVGSHDTSRVLSYLDGIDDDRKDTSIGAAFPTYEKTSDLAKQRQYLVAFLQFTYAGAPTIYYGDEIGMVGADDP
ncbi:MAG: alpha-amylase family glycosyl hydrolase, partial [Roseburia sp.]|nr:alpha-amylase family glycosyl hydrolase [Roseburia sp.]